MDDRAGKARAGHAPTLARSCHVGQAALGQARRGRRGGARHRNAAHIAEGPGNVQHDDKRGTAMTRSTRENVRRAGWALLLALAFYYLYRALSYRFLTPGQLGPTLFDKQFWFFSHLLLALPVLVGAPLQFSQRLRKARPDIHRALGKVYVVCATGAGLTAIYLGATISLEGSRLPIVLLGCLWIFFTLAAWRCAVRRDFDAHRRFMIRSYGLALVLVWLRLMGDVPGDLMFFYIADQAVRDTTLEWMSWVVPLLVIEMALSWLPLLNRKKARG